MEQTWKHLLKQHVLKISLVYAIFGGAWILFSDSFVDKILRHHEILSTVKGILFAVVTACLLYFMIRHYEQEVRERENQLRTLINSMPDFINFKDGEGRWLEANDIALSLLELEGVSYQGKKDSELAKFSPRFRDELMACEASDEATWKQGATTRFEEVIPKSDGGSAIFDTIKVPIFHPDGSRKGIVVIGRDITERKKDTELLLTTEKLAVIGQLAAGVAHEIRNPLTSLKGFIQLLSKKAENQAYCAIMLPELERVNQIVGEFLTIAKPQVQILKATSLPELVQDVIVLLNTNAIEKNVEIIMDYDSNTSVVNGDENQLKQVVINILKNAIEASAPGGRIKIHIQRFGLDMVTIRVVDNGYGIDEESIPKLGEPFFTTKEKGTGLGLLVCRRILEAHSGSLLISSQEGVGTSVDIILPVSHVEEGRIHTNDKVEAYNG